MKNKDVYENNGKTKIKGLLKSFPLYFGCLEGVFLFDPIYGLQNNIFPPYPCHVYPVCGVYEVYVLPDIVLAPNL
jgi:hypothetical protein